MVLKRVLKMVAGSHPRQLESTGFTPGPIEFKGLVEYDSEFDRSPECSEHRRDGANLLVELCSMEAANAARHAELTTYLGSKETKIATQTSEL